MAYAYDDDDFPPPPTREGVERDLADWRDRLNGLYDLVEGWLPATPAATVTRSDDFKMLEPMMTATGQGAVMMPSLRLDFGSGKEIRVQPEARWVIGIRGWARIGTPGKSVRLLDVGTPGKPFWKIYPKRDAVHSVPFTREEFEIVLREAL